MAPWVTEEFLVILSGLVDSYIKSKGSERKEVVEQTVLEVKACAEKGEKAIPPGLEKVLSPCHHPCGFDTHLLQESDYLVPELSTEEAEAQILKI